jgi:hypothetical protein
MTPHAILVAGRFMWVTPENTPIQYLYEVRSFSLLDSLFLSLDRSIMVRTSIYRYNEDLALVAIGKRKEAHAIPCQCHREYGSTHT